MATIASLVDDIRPMIATGVPEVSMEESIRWSAREFLRKTRWLRDTVTIGVSAGVNCYALSTSVEDAEVFGIQAAQIDDDYLTPARQEDVAPGSVGWYFFEPPSTILLSWSPAANGALHVRTFLNLVPTATAIPDDVLRQWNAAISYGALSRLLLMAAAPWFNAELGKFYAGRYTEDLNAALIEADRQSVHVPVRPS